MCILKQCTGIKDDYFEDYYAKKRPQQDQLLTFWMTVNKNWKTHTIQGCNQKNFPACTSFSGLKPTNIRESSDSRGGTPLSLLVTTMIPLIDDTYPHEQTDLCRFWCLQLYHCILILPNKVSTKNTFPHCMDHITKGEEGDSAMVTFNSWVDLGNLSRFEIFKNKSWI